MYEENWAKIAPSWPLKNLIAVNPLQGLEDLSIEKAMLEARVLFEQKVLPKPMESINRQTIKWLQAFFDEGQATIPMPLRTQGLYQAWKKLAYFDCQIHGNHPKKKKWLSNKLSLSPEMAITECLVKLNIPEENQSLFLTLMLTTLPGWASYIKYRSQSQQDYMAIRVIITALLWEEAADLLEWYKKCKALEAKKNNPIKAIEKNETTYLLSLLKKLESQQIEKYCTPNVQLVFCIDVRSEPFRRALEKRGNYETFGCAGFFGLPIRIKNRRTQELYASCPVLLQPEHTVIEHHKGYQKLNIFRRLYQSLKYNFTTSFVLVDLLGLLSGLCMALRTMIPFSKIILDESPVTYSLKNISFSDQCYYATSALKTIGLTKNFSSLIVLCGHGSTTQNNAYATALDCGACGGRHGGSNAKILAKILNTATIRSYLHKIGILIPASTYFLGAEHNTTTDAVEIDTPDSDQIVLLKKIQQLKIDLQEAGKINSHNRSHALQHSKVASMDWAQVRPEWGLARNASFIVGPRQKTKKMDLQGRVFLHSYDYREDVEGSILTLILTAPMVVAQWINNQYLFSTLDNVAYGSGSKVTQNITGKIGVMQGNASDLMTGLPLQSVYITDQHPYHEPVRLSTIVYAPCDFIDKIIKKESVLQKLFGNGWVMLISIDPGNTNNYYVLGRDLKWKNSICNPCNIRCSY